MDVPESSKGNKKLQKTTAKKSSEKEDAEKVLSLGERGYEGNLKTLKLSKVNKILDRSNGSSTKDESFDSCAPLGVTEEEMSEMLDESWVQDDDEEKYNNFKCISESKGKICVDDLLGMKENISPSRSASAFHKYDSRPEMPSIRIGDAELLEHDQTDSSTLPLLSRKPVEYKEKLTKIMTLPKTKKLSSEKLFQPSLQQNTNAFDKPEEPEDPWIANVAYFRNLDGYASNVSDSDYIAMQSRMLERYESRQATPITRPIPIRRSEYKSHAERRLSDHDASVRDSLSPKKSYPSTTLSKLQKLDIPPDNSLNKLSELENLPLPSFTDAFQFPKLSYANLSEDKSSRGSLPKFEDWALEPTSLPLCANSSKILDDPLTCTLDPLYFTELSGEARDFHQTEVKLASLFKTNEDDLPILQQPDIGFRTRPSRLSRTRSEDLLCRKRKMSMYEEQESRENENTLWTILQEAVKVNYTKKEMSTKSTQTSPTKSSNDGNLQNAVQYLLTEGGEPVDNDNILDLCCN